MFTVSAAVLLSVGQVTVTVTGTVPSWGPAVHNVCAAVGFARERGARALEAYPLRTEPGQRISTDEIHVGSPSIFEAAGLVEVNRPTLRRSVMRIDF